ncbi:MAG: dephospho-CoA kinase, partial [Pseudomonadota bacterium]
MTIVIGLTGSIGMGKSTTAAIFADEGVPVWDADAAVHRLYQPYAQGWHAIWELVPEAARATGVDRSVLKEQIAKDPNLLEAI